MTPRSTAPLRRMLLVLVIVGSLTALFTFGLLRGNPDRNVPSNYLGRAVPNFELPLYERYVAAWGPTLDLADFAGKRPMVINFWASWCGPCYVEAPHLEAAQRAYGDRVLFVGVQTQERDARAAGRAFLDRFDFTFPNVIDDDSRVSISYGLFGVPETFFVRADGTLAYKHVGPVDAQVMRERVEALLP
jgi:cytochrome c biogenesis protein CcmG, thiol:disulfide interchange protein DsbE